MQTAEQKRFAPDEASRGRAGQGTVSRFRASLTIALAALILCWPAFYNRYPFLYPDSISYLSGGRRIADAVLHLRFGRLGYMRSPLYSLGIWLLHWDRSPWPVVIFHAVVTAWLLWLVCRSILPRWRIAGFLSLITALAFLTGVSWVVCWVLPDILGAALYLSLYLLVFARDTLSRTEAFMLSCLLVWSANSHITHLMLAVFLSALLGVLMLLWPTVMRARAKAVAHIAGLVVLALMLQITANGLLTGSWSFAGKHPPFLTARLLGDGPARTLLQEHCGESHFTLCQFKDTLPTDSGEFLWGQGILTQATPAQVLQIGREEMPLLYGTLRAHPWQQARVSLHNFCTQLTYYDIEGFGNSAWAELHLSQVMPGADTLYRRSRQARDAVASDPFSDIQGWTIPIAALTLCAALPFCWHRRHTRLLGLSVIVAVVIVGNAFLTGVLSQPDSRYQVRIIWLLPLLAVLALLRLAEDRRARPRMPAA